MDKPADQSSAIDISVRALFRECPAAALRLAGLNVPPEDIRVEDPNINLPELRADHVFIIPLSQTDPVSLSEATEPEIAVYLEYQLASHCASLRGDCRERFYSICFVRIAI